MESVTPTILSVGQLNTYIKSMVDSDYHLKNVFLIGEISNFTNHLRTGHYYMTLKDEKSAIKAVMFRSYASRLKFMPENGMKIIALGSVSVFERDGQYQFYIEDMQPDGLGSLNLAFEQLKEKLEKEGLFDHSHKKPIPKYPKRIGVVTSPTGAALQDIKNVLSRRWPMAEVIICPAQVQGTEATGQIVKAIKRLDTFMDTDVMIVARGGGSIEDLWAFNDERVARAVYDCCTPVISGVGHETDTTIVDFVADYRAPTPSAAAEVAVPDQFEERERVRALQNSNVLMSPHSLINERRILLDKLIDSLNVNVNRKVQNERNHFSLLVGKLDAYCPLKVLSRGYSIATCNGKVTASIDNVKTDDLLDIKVKDGIINCKVLEITRGNGIG